VLVLLGLHASFTRRGTVRKSLHPFAPASGITELPDGILGVFPRKILGRREPWYGRDAARAVRYGAVRYGAVRYGARKALLDVDHMHVGWPRRVLTRQAGGSPRGRGGDDTRWDWNRTDLLWIRIRIGVGGGRVWSVVSLDRLNRAHLDWSPSDIITLLGFHCWLLVPYCLLGVHCWLLGFHCWLLVPNCLLGLDSWLLLPHCCLLGFRCWLLYLAYLYGRSRNEIPRRSHDLRFVDRWRLERGGRSGSSAQRMFIVDVIITGCYSAT
jgi:hypothetical protein